jgi:hypothetical protein
MGEQLTPPRPMPRRLAWYLTAVTWLCSLAGIVGILICPDTSPWLLRSGAIMWAIVVLFWERAATQWRETAEDAESLLYKAISALMIGDPE